MLYLIYYSDGEHKTHIMRSVRLLWLWADASWNGGRLVAGTDGLREFLLVGDGMLPGDVACHGLPEDRSEFGKKKQGNN